MRRRSYYAPIAALLLLATGREAAGHVGHGHVLPEQARKLRNPLSGTKDDVATGEHLFQKNCASCHGQTGKADTPAAFRMVPRPVSLVDHAMKTMRGGEIWWVETYGEPPGMPGFEKTLSGDDRWRIVLWIKQLQERQRAEERSKLGGDYDWQLPPGFPYPKIPADNSVTNAKVKLGRRLFYDKRLSGNRTQSCATCHQQRFAFTDGRPQAIGSTKERHPRGSMSLANVAYSPALTWANPNMRRLEEQALVPLFGEHPVEMGSAGKEADLLSRLKADARYCEWFRDAFPSPQPITLANTVKAIAAFERTILSGRSPYDDYRSGENSQAISDAAKRGESLFFSERTECFHCHGGFNFTGTVDYQDKGFAEVEFHNNALYNLKAEISYPHDNTGLYEFTRDPADVGRFKAPSLRNVAVTAPYMHDGSIRTLGQVIEHYAVGGRTIRRGPYTGIGADNPNRSEFVKVMDLNANEKTDLVAFLQSLTDRDLLQDERYSDPWIAERQKPRHLLRGTIREVDETAGTLLIKHGAVDSFMPAMTMEFHLVNRDDIHKAKVGGMVEADVSKRGDEYWLANVRVVASQ